MASSKQGVAWLYPAFKVSALDAWDAAAWDALVARDARDAAAEMHVHVLHERCCTRAVHGWAGTPKTRVLATSDVMVLHSTRL